MTITQRYSVASIMAVAAQALPISFTPMANHPLQLLLKHHRPAHLLGYRVRSRSLIPLQKVLLPHRDFAKMVAD